MAKRRRRFVLVRGPPLAGWLAGWRSGEKLASAQCPAASSVPAGVVARLARDEKETVVTARRRRTRAVGGAGLRG
jgi:hypothetical protein